MRRNISDVAPKLPPGSAHRSLPRLRCLPGQLGLRIPRGLDDLSQRVIATFGKHFIALEGRNDIGASVNPADRFEHLRIEGSDLALGGVYCGGADVLGRRDSPVTSI